MKGMFLLIIWFMGLYSWFLGCQIVADKEFRECEGKRTGWMLLAAWLILGLIWLVIGGQ